MEPYQQRVLEERAELEKKVISLDQFIGGKLFKDTLDPKAQQLMKDQLMIMKQYINVLTERINLWYPQ